MPTTATGSAGYCDGEAFVARFDYRTAAQLLVDVEANTTPLTQTQVEDHATLAIHLSIHNLATAVADLLPAYGADCPTAIVWRASWPDQRIVRCTLGTAEAAIAGGMERTALILVGRVLGGGDFADSRLYAGDYDRRFRPQSAASPFAGATE